MDGQGGQCPVAFNQNEQKKPIGLGALTVPCPWTTEDLATPVVFSFTITGSNRCGV